MKSRRDISQMMRAEMEEGAAIIDRTFSGVVFFKEDLADKEISDCTFEKCVFSSASFANALLESVTFVDCDFEDCSFAPSDIKSCTFLRVDFNWCFLNESFVDNCTFSEIRFLETQIKTTSVTNCTILDSNFTSVDPTSTSFFHNRFYGGTWEDSDFSHASFGYNIVKISKAINSPLSPMGALLSVGVAELYGTSDISGYYDGLLENIGRSRISQGKRNLIDLLRNVAIGEISVLGSFDRYFDNYPRTSAGVIRINKEELAFVLLVIEELAIRNVLPGTTMVKALQWAQNEILSLKQKGGEADVFESQPALYNFYAKVMLLLEKQAKKLESERIHIERYKSDIAVQVVATFTTKPEFEFADLLNQIAFTPSLIPKNTPISLRSYEGSYKEVLNVTFRTLVALQIFIFMADGIILRSIPLKNHFLQLTGVKHVDDQNLPALMNELFLPPFLKLPIIDMAQFTNSWHFKDDPKLGGLSNLQSIAPVEVDNQEDSKIG